jgi:hypothetical protein
MDFTNGRYVDNTKNKRSKVKNRSEEHLEKRTRQMDIRGPYWKVPIWELKIVPKWMLIIWPRYGKEMRF